MAIQSADKIFVDVNDEINFVVEKIFGSRQPRIIVAIPQNALVVSSLVSMKILAKQIAKSDKLVIIVTEDKFGMQLAERSGLVSANKVSSISPETWEVAQIKKEKAKSEIAEKKEMLLTDRGILPVKDETDSEEVETVTELPETNIPHLEEEEELGEEGEVEVELEGEEGVEIGEEKVEDIVEPEPEPEEEIKGPIQRKRLPGKMVTVSGIQVFAGGDIANIGAPKGDIISPVSLEETISDTQDMEEDKPKKEKAGGFTGRDWTSATKDVKPKTSKGLAAILPFKPSTPSLDGEDSPVQKLIKSKFLWIGVGSVIVLGALAVYLLAFVLASVEIRLELKTTDVPVDDQIITADTSYLDVDTEELIIPARIISADVTGSISGQATGKGQRGEKAAGLIDIWNKTTEERTLAAGTKLTSAQTGLKYVLVQEVTVPAGEQSGPVVDPGKIETRIEAEALGDNYNIESSDDTNVSFKIEGIATDKVEGKRFAAISGGTSEEFVAVSKQDVTKRKEALQERLEGDAINQLREQVGSDEIMLTGSEEYEEVEAVVTPDIGEEAEDFNLDLEIKATAIVVQKEHLDKAIAALVAQQQETDIDFEVDSLSGSVIGNVTRDEGVASFNVSSKGSLTSKVDEQQVKEAVAGMGIAEAKEYLEVEVAAIETARIIYSPVIVPEFLRRIPSDPEKILIVTN